MITNPIKEALLRRKITLGSWIQTGPYPAIAEILAETGFDWLAIDCEHSDINIAGLASLARGMYGRKSVPLARVRKNDVLAIRQALDLGAQGVIVPLVNSAEEARQAVKAAKYPPKGIRGFCFSRMNNYGLDFKNYAETANANIPVVVMIETKEAVERIDEIISTDGVDGVFVGPYDMSGSYNVTGDTEHALIKKACQRVVRACEKYRKSAGIHVVLPDRDKITEAMDKGFTFIALGVDTVFLRTAARAALDLAREAMARKQSTPERAESEFGSTCGR